MTLICRLVYPPYLLLLLLLLTFLNFLILYSWLKLQLIIWDISLIIRDISLLAYGVSLNNVGLVDFNVSDHKAASLHIWILNHQAVSVVFLVCECIYV